MSDKCSQCGLAWDADEHMACVPPKDKLNYGEYKLSPAYKAALYDSHPNYTVEEVVGSYLGYNQLFPDEETWLKEQDEEEEEEEEGEAYSDVSESD